jgi:hypothetical protein
LEYLPGARRAAGLFICGEAKSKNRGRGLIYDSAIVVGSSPTRPPSQQRLTGKTESLFLIVGQLEKEESFVRYKYYQTL